MNKSLAAGTVLVLLAAVGAGVTAQDEEVTAPWHLKFTHGPLDVITVPYADGSARSFNYFTFTLEAAGTEDASLRLHIKADVASGPRKQKVHYAIPYADAEEYVRRMSRAKDLKNLQQINRMGKLKKGEKIKGIAVLGSFSREWDVATVTVSGLEPRAIRCRVRKFGGSGFTLAHRAYTHHNKRVREKAGKEADFSETFAIVRHDVVRRMQYHREGDEFAPQLDPIYLDSEGWEVVDDPGPAIVMELAAPFGK